MLGMSSSSNQASTSSDILAAVYRYSLEGATIPSQCFLAHWLQFQPKI